MKAILVLVLAIAFAIAPFLSPEFGGIPPEIYPVPQNNPPVQPAGWAFSIWGIIYLGLIGHGIYGFINRRKDAIWDKGRLALCVSLFVGVFWLPVALVSPVWATVLIWVMLAGALTSLYQTRVAQPNWAINLPVALYAGWLTAASFVSIGLILAGYGLTGEVYAAIIALLLATVFAFYNQAKLNLWTYGAAVAWGFSGIVAANWGDQWLVAVPSLFASVGVAGLALFKTRQA